MNKNIFFCALFLLVLAAVLCGIWLPVQAQAPQGQALMTWQALNFYPADFRGKALPTEGSRVAVSVAFTESGRFRDLSRVTIRWYIDGTFAARGTGLTEFPFTVTGRNGDTQVVRAAIEFSANSRFESSVIIPVGSRRLALRSSAEGTLVPDTDAGFEAFPYFFNVASLSDLIFFWSVNGVRVSKVNGSALSLTVPHTAGPLEVSVIAQGARDLIEYGSGKMLMPVAQ